MKETETPKEESVSRTRLSIQNMTTVSKDQSSICGRRPVKCRGPRAADIHPNKTVVSINVSSAD